MSSVLPWAISVALLAVRLTVALALSPAFTAYGVPATVRVALTFALAALTFVYRAPVPAASAWASEPALLLVPVAKEIFIGALLGLGVQVVLAALALAGRLMDVQTGFAIGSVFDPVARTSSNVLGSMTGLLGVTLFFVSDAHLHLAQPLGTFVPSREFYDISEGMLTGGVSSYVGGWLTLDPNRVRHVDITSAIGQEVIRGAFSMQGPCAPGVALGTCFSAFANFIHGR